MEAAVETYILLQERNRCHAPRRRADARLIAGLAGTLVAVTLSFTAPQAAPHATVAAHDAPERGA